VVGCKIKAMFTITGQRLNPHFQAPFRIAAMRKLVCLFSYALCASIALASATALAGGFPPFNRAAGETPSGQPVPRFVSLKFSTIRGRAGPDLSYPIRWEYKRKGLPVRVIAETEEWRRIQDPEGAISWVHRRMIDGRRTGIVRPARDMRVALHVRPDSATRITAYASDGVIVEITDERQGWRQIKSGRFTGWVPAAELWGAENAATR
jgi:SH3-like domain-containing protein